jgi:hypothetical protein
MFKADQVKLEQVKYFLNRLFPLITTILFFLVILFYYIFFESKIFLVFGIFLHGCIFYFYALEKKAMRALLTSYDDLRTKNLVFIDRFCLLNLTCQDQHLHWYRASQELQVSPYSHGILYSESEFLTILNNPNPRKVFEEKYKI